jgi:hypothetical protein
MAAQTQLTELQAVNIILKNIGLAPVNSLTVSPSADVVAAQAALDEAQRSVLMEGWEFNTEKDYPLEPDNDGYIEVPSDFFRYRAMDPTTRVTTREGKLYDLDERSFEFDDTLEVEAVVALDWDDLPEAARQYMAIKAAREFSHDMMEDANAGKFDEASELRARAALVESESENARHSMFDNYQTWEGVGVNRWTYIQN